MKRRNYITIALALSVMLAQGQTKQYWNIEGENQIVFDALKTTNLPYKDNIEMAGKRVAGIVTYNVDAKGNLSLQREVFFPQLHQVKPTNASSFFDYRAYLQDMYGDNLLPKLYIGGEQFALGKLSKIYINGKLNFEHEPSAEGITVVRSLFPSMDERSFVEYWTLTNNSDKSVSFTSANNSLKFEDYSKEGLLTRQVSTDAPANFSLAAGESISFSMTIKAANVGEQIPSQKANTALEKRNDYIEKMSSSLVLETPSEELNTLFEFSKIRASESIFESKLGLIHSPGGGRYYVGFWANDQAEYVSPFFPYLGYDLGIESAMSCYRAFAKETNPEFKPLRYSFEVEGLPPFILDRGDAAMIAYGATHFVMASGDKAIATELWPLIEWCLEYNHRNLNNEGVVKSQSDEMEGRIETGTANLSTSSLYYGALKQAINLAKSLDVSKKQVAGYSSQMKDLAVAIESYFGSNVEGLDTYKYYKEHTVLRHWICLPLVVGINDRKDATLEALFNRLWTDNGVHVERNNPKPDVSKIFWDRGTLYALRGAFYAGETERSLKRLEEFTEQRLLGSRVPYVVEAAPEGAMAHLSAESALYCRIFTEGILGMEPIGLNTIQIKPNLPKKWNYTNLKHIKTFGHDFDVNITRGESKLHITISENGKKLYSKSIKEGEVIKYTFKS